MIKSTNDQANSGDVVVGMQDVGKRVIVGKMRTGVLKYVGRVGGKEGIFCGVELDIAAGLHNGTYQGVKYFECIDKHGIFAPIYRVELYPQTTSMPGREEVSLKEKLVRSAMPSIGTTPSYPSTIPSMDVSMASVSSMGTSSFLLDNSMVMNGSWNSDQMFSSNATYTITPAHMNGSWNNDQMFSSNATYTINPATTNTRYEFLEDIECPSTLIDVSDDSFPTELPTNSTSQILDESKIGVDHLPVINDEASTPLVEYRTFTDDTKQQEISTSSFSPHSSNNNNPFLSDLFASDDLSQYNYDDIASDYLINEDNTDVTYIIRTSPLQKSSSQMSMDSVTSDDHQIEPMQEGVIEPTPIMVEKQSNNNNFVPSKSGSKKSPTKKSANATNITSAKKRMTLDLAKRNATPDQINEHKEERPRKPKPPSIRELQNAPTPKPKPKPPSKSQLLMEQIKASIAADKRKPKKEIKSKLSEILAVHFTPTATPTNENQGMAPGEDSKKPTVSPNAKRRRNEPLKSLNAKPSASTSNSNATPRAPTKPRQSLLPPKIIHNKATKGNEPLKKTSNLSRTGSSSTVCSARIASTTNASTPKSKVGTKQSSKVNVAPSTATTSHLSTNKRTNTKKPQEDDAWKLKRLNRAILAFDALSIVLDQTLQKGESEITALSDEKHDLECRMSSLMEKYERMVSALDVEHRRELENVTTSHQQQVESIQQRYEKKLNEIKEGMRHALDDQKCAHDLEVERLSRTHQIQIATMDSKLCEAEKQSEQLIRDKKALEATLSKDTNQKVVGLSKEISSLNAALEMKSSEMKQLRHINAKLQLKAEEIPSKDIEISKLKHRVYELKLLVDQKVNTEKILAAKYEELQRSARSHAMMSESMLKENDLLRYKIEEMESSTSESEHNLPKQQVDVSITTPVSTHHQSVTYRSRPAQSDIRPSSSTLPSRLTRSHQDYRMRQSGDDNALTRSIISVYLEQGRNRLSGSNADTIYAPEGTFIARGKGAPRRLLFNDTNDDHDADDEGSARRMRPCDPGDGTYCDTVTDSGISL